MESSTPHSDLPLRSVPLKKRRLNKPHMYKKVFEGGTVLRGVPLTLRYCLADQEHSRIGFIIRKKVGDAPMRNSIRRTLRCSFQAALPHFLEGTWIVFDVSDKASKCRRGELRAEADRLLGSIPAGSPLAGHAAPIVKPAR